MSVFLSLTVLLSLTMFAWVCFGVMISVSVFSIFRLIYADYNNGGSTINDIERVFVYSSAALAFFIIATSLTGLLH